MNSIPSVVAATVTPPFTVYSYFTGVPAFAPVRLPRAPSFRLMVVVPFVCSVGMGRL